MAKQTTGADLNKRWRVGAAHALYIHDGHWYHQLKRFPGALFDQNGYVVFTTKKEFLRSPYLRIAKHVHIRRPGISAIPGYVQVIHSRGKLSSSTMPTIDVDIHKPSSTAIEGRRRLIAHLQRERNKALIRKKKRQAASLHCEVCGFSFARAYGRHAGEYCEVHHLVPLAEAEQLVTTRLEDLAILCANCHRVVHLHYPPYRLEEVRRMLRNRKAPESNHVR
jgi:5-methylcytosine-specific restriction protein A